jgi:hypothetical protein
LLGAALRISDAPARCSVWPHDVRPAALKMNAAVTGRQRALGSSSSMRSAASHEYGDIAAK